MLGPRRALLDGSELEGSEPERRAPSRCPFTGTCQQPSRERQLPRPQERHDRLDPPVIRLGLGEIELAEDAANVLVAHCK